MIFGINGVVLMQSMRGYDLPMSYCWIPVALATTASGSITGAWTGIWLGFWLAFDVSNGINYYTVYGVMVLAVVLAASLRV